ncbi:MAG: hypothetical protein WC945_08570 [Bacteroidales bacterium]
MPINSRELSLMGNTIGLFDLIGFVLALTLLIIYLVSFVKDKKRYGKIDAPRHYTNK